MFKAVLLDFDFTLADSTAGAVDCINFALARLGFPEYDDATIRSTIGLSLPATLERLTGVSDGASAEAFRRAFVERADRVMVDLIELYETVPHVVAVLRAAGLPLGIVSTKYRRRIAAVLERDGILDSFTIIVGGEDVPRHKPDPSGLLLALDRLGIEPAAAVYVGDHPVDAETAAGAGTAFVAVLTGTSTAGDFDGRPIGMIDTLAAFPPLVIDRSR
jgi:phosphoglycolate phosphatase